jgi:hypothetical protein
METPSTCIRTMAHLRSSEMGLPLGMHRGRGKEARNASLSDAFDGASSVRRDASIPRWIGLKIDKGVGG